MTHTALIHNAIPEKTPMKKSTKLMLNGAGLVTVAAIGAFAFMKWHEKGVLLTSNAAAISSLDSSRAVVAKDERMPRERVEELASLSADYRLTPRTVLEISVALNTSGARAKYGLTVKDVVAIADKEKKLLEPQKNPDGTSTISFPSGDNDAVNRKAAALTLVQSLSSEAISDISGKGFVSLPPQPAPKQEPAKQQKGKQGKLPKVEKFPSAKHLPY